MAMSCPSCGSQETGKFCSQCGSALATPKCKSCGNAIPAGGRFCNMCGTAVAGGPRKAESTKGVPAAAQASGRPRSNLPWAIAGGALVVLAGALILPRLGGEQEPIPSTPAPFAGPAAGGTGTGGAAGVDLSSMTPREAADRLFNRVMQAAESGDSAQARSFAPMALAAYDMVPDLDLDGRYHVAVIQLATGQPSDALTTSEAILAEVPTHLFGLATAAEAQLALGNTAEAAALWQQFLANYDTEVLANRVEYRDHAALLPTLRQQAASQVQSR